MSKEKTVKARVLSQNQYGAINDLVELSESAAESAVAAGMVDTHPSAVKLAEELAAEKAKAKKAAEAEAKAKKAEKAKT